MREIRLDPQGSSNSLSEAKEGLRTVLRKWRWTRKPPWPGFGDSFNGQEFRRRTVDLLIERFKPDQLVETGTFMGFTTRPLAAKGIDTYTVEVDPGYYWMAARDLKDIPNLTLIHGDSGTAIEKLGADGTLTRPFVYLDAHWEERLPLNDEVKALCAHCEDFLVVVDDFKVPGMPDYGYDTYGDQSLSLELITLDDDVIVAFPATPPEEETGSKRGAVYLGRGERARVALDAALEAGLVSVHER